MWVNAAGVCVLTRGEGVREGELQRIMAHASISGRNMLDYQVGEGRVG